ncbi:MAG: hypothetical protein GY708_30965 [Actinomycetia bacterium]|nr:hypothetical protein [Actinomycetes bacterium]MCP4961717.1 hypothetical protein [Actinomycetes bacterium]
MQNHRLLVALLTLLALAAACSDSDTVAAGTSTTAVDTTTATISGSSDEQALEAALQRWAATDTASYSIVYQHNCFCPMEEIAVVVVDGKVVSAKGEAGVEPQFARQPMTVDDMFDEIRTAIDGGAAAIDVSYDPDLGYPTNYWIDEALNIADEEHGITVFELTPAAG